MITAALMQYSHVFFYYYYVQSCLWLNLQIINRVIIQLRKIALKLTCTLPTQHQAADSYQLAGEHILWSWSETKTELKRGWIYSIQCMA